MNTIGERLKKLRGKASGEEFAAKHNVHPQTLYRYERDERKPDIDFIQSVANESNASIDWIIRGENAPQPSIHQNDHVTRESLQLAIEAVEEGLHAARRTLPPDKKAALILAAYDLIEESGSTGKVIELIRIVA